MASDEIPSPQPSSLRLSESRSDNLSTSETRDRVTHDLESASEKYEDCSTPQSPGDNIPSNSPQTSQARSGRRLSLPATLSRFRSSSTAGARHVSWLSKGKSNTDGLVDFDGPDDPYRPLNWPFRKKVISTLLYSLTTAGISFASSVISPGVPQLASEFHVSAEVARLSISLLIFGFAVGPLLWAPLSELYGRKIAVLTPYFVALCFIFLAGAAKDLQAVLIARFFAGLFGSAPITNTGGAMGDIWPAQHRGQAIVGYSIAVIGAPLIGPLVGGALVNRLSDGWRWTEYVTGIFMAVALVLDIFLVDESYAPCLLTYKARKLRLDTDNWALRAKHEQQSFTVRGVAEKYLIRPMKMLGTPICALVALYGSFVYGILYANLSAFTIAYQDGRGWNPVLAGLPFIAVLCGVLIGSLVVLWNSKYYFRRWKANNNKSVPEARLPSMMVGSIVLATGMFIFAWTSNPAIHWAPSIVGCVFIGFGFFTIYQASVNYLVDTFTTYGASAMAANTFLRSGWAGGFPLIIAPMYGAIGVEWGTTVWALFATVLIPVPFVFWRYGPAIRARGVWSRDSTL